MQRAHALPAVLTIAALCSGSDSAGAETPTARFGDVESSTMPAAPLPPSVDAPAVQPSAATPLKTSPPAAAARPPAAPKTAPPSVSRKPAPAAPPPPPPLAAGPLVYQEIVDPFPLRNPYTEPADPYVDVRGAPPVVDELLIVNPYSRLLSTDTEGARYFDPPVTAASTASLEIFSTPTFKGSVYLNGMALASLPSRTVLLAGEHGITVVPAGGSPVTVWVQVAAGEQRKFKFGLGGPALSKTAGALPPR